MPQAARASSARGAGNVERDPTTKAQEQEFKRARGAISCAECRRLKLKCDKTVPCSSCKRRGCASICPNGSLTTGQGTRFILADTDRLHRKISEMSDRIRQLEDGLAILQSSTTREAHSLLRPDLLTIKSGLELHSAINPVTGQPQTEREMEEASQAIDHFGTLAIEERGGAKYYGSSAGSESLLVGEKPDAQVKTEAEMLPLDVEELARTFPASTLQLDGADTLQVLIEDYLPEWPRAEQLAYLYLEQAPWFFGAIRQRQLLEELLPMFYAEAQANLPQSSESAHSQGGSPSSNLAASTSEFALAAAKSTTNGNSTGAAHDLALLFVVFCFGALTDPHLPPAPLNKEASTYYQLTRAALNLQPVLEGAPSVATVQTLSLMGIYQGLVADENSIESTWALMGLSCKLAQSIGLHRDCARWKLPPAEVQKRRALFWELFITDCWQSLATGRLPSFALPFVDCELAEDTDQALADDGSTIPSFPAWKAMWGKECVSGVVELTLQSRAPRYSLILELDRKIRDIELPKYAEIGPPQSASMSETMKHFMPINYRELTMLYLHRTFFAQALKEYPTDPLRSQYAPSFLAGYRAACALIFTVREQFCINPVQIARFWVLWTHAFSSTVMLGSVVTHGGSTKTAQAALGEMRLAYDLFEKAAKYGGRAVKFLPIVRRIHDKAYNVFSQGYQRPTKDIFSARDAQNDGDDELAIFSGRTRMVATKSAAKPSGARHRSISRKRVASTVHSPDSVSSSSGSDPSHPSLSPPTILNAGSPSTPPEPSESLYSLESYGTTVHPMLVDQIRSFEGELDTQIYNAQQAFYLANASSSEASAMSGGSNSPAEGQYSTMYSQDNEQPQFQVQQWRLSDQMPPPPNVLSVPQEQPHIITTHLNVPSAHHHHQSVSPASSTLSPAEHAFSVPMYGGVEGGSHQVPEGHVYPVRPHPVAPLLAPVPPPMASLQPDSVPASQYQQPELWQVPASYTHQHHPQQYHSQPMHEGYHSYHQPIPATGRPQSMHGQSYSHQQHHIPPPAVLPLHGQGAYNLQDSWNSFFQHELPAPSEGPGGSRPNAGPR